MIPFLTRQRAFEQVSDPFKTFPARNGEYNALDDEVCPWIQDVGVQVVGIQEVGLWGLDLSSLVHACSAIFLAPPLARARSPFPSVARNLIRSRRLDTAAHRPQVLRRPGRICQNQPPHVRRPPRACSLQRRHSDLPAHALHGEPPVRTTCPPYSLLPAPCTLHPTTLIKLPSPRWPTVVKHPRRPHDMRAMGMTRG